MNPYRRAMQRALAAMDAAAMTTVCRAHKDKARSFLCKRPVVMTNYGYRIVDRWFRRVAYRAPRDLGKFIHGATFEEPRRINGETYVQVNHQGMLLWKSKAKLGLPSIAEINAVTTRRWKGIPEAKS